jgi:hypothetical protein
MTAYFSLRRVISAQAYHAYRVVRRDPVCRLHLPIASTTSGAGDIRLLILKPLTSAFAAKQTLQRRHSVNSPEQHPRRKTVGGIPLSATIAPATAWACRFETASQ